MLVLGAALIATGTFAVSYFGAVEVEAQGGPKMQCDWDGNYCKKPIDKTPCGCEDPTGT